MLDWSSPEFNRVVLDWTIIDGKNSAAEFANQIRTAPRTPGRRTSISGAIEMGALMLEASEKNIVATRRVIDVSGDGPNNDGRPLGDAHKEVMMQKIIINGLPIMDENANGYYPNLDKYFAGCVVGGTGAFVVVVRSFKDFGAAMRRKLILEISSDENQIKQVENELSDLLAVHQGAGRAERPERRRAGHRDHPPDAERVLGAVRPQRLRLRRLLRLTHANDETRRRSVRGDGCCRGGAVVGACATAARDVVEGRADAGRAQRDARRRSSTARSTSSAATARRCRTARPSTSTTPASIRSTTRRPNSWRTLAPMPQGSNHPGIAALDGKIYVAGGFEGPGHMAVDRPLLCL